MKEKIARWYGQGLWSADMVRNAVKKKILTEGEAAEILGEKKPDGQASDRFHSASDTTWVRN